VPSTICDLNPFLANCFRDPGEAGDPSVPATESYSSTPDNPKTQGAASLSSAEGLTASVLRLVDSASALHASAGGSTVSLTDGDLLGRKLFAVSIYPERSVELITPPTWQNIFAFALLNLDLLTKPRHAFGSWINLSHVLDVVICLPRVRTALELGRIFNERSIYDLETAQETMVGTEKQFRYPSVLIP
jgi:hypothetical protein